MDIVGDLLPELAQRILLLLNLEEIEIVWNSIEEWKHLLDDCFWRKVCKRNNYQEKEGYLTSDIYREYMLESSLHWRAIYKYNQLIKSHWSDGNFRFVSIEGDKQYDGINYFDDEILVLSTVLSDTVLNVDIVDLSTGKTLSSFTKEKRGVRTERHQDLLIFLTSKTLKLWSLEAKSWFLDVELEKTEVVLERKKLKPLDIYKNRLVFLLSSDCLYLVNLETKEVHLNNNRDIDDVCFGDNIIILLSKNTNTIITLNLDGEVLTKIDYSGNLEIEDVMTKGGFVIIYYSQVDGEHFRKVSVYTIQQDTKELQEVSSINVVYSFQRFFPNNNTILFCNCINAFRRQVTYMLWKLATKNGTIVNFGYYQDPLESVAANNCYIFMCDMNSMLTMWCLETGKCIRTISDKKLKKVNVKVTENKLAYLNCDKLLCIQNFDFVESRIDVPSKS